MKDLVVIDIAGSKVACNAVEFLQVISLYREFNGYSIFSDDVCITPYNDDKNVQLFADLNKPYTDDDLDYAVAMWGEEYVFDNKEADSTAISNFNIFFNVLVWLDGCETYFRTSADEE